MRIPADRIRQKKGENLMGRSSVLSNRGENDLSREGRVRKIHRPGLVGYRAGGGILLSREFYV